MELSQDRYFEEIKNSSAGDLVGTRTKSYLRAMTYINDELTDTRDRLMRKEEIAQRLGVHPRSVDNWIRSRKLPYIRLGRCIRFRWRDVDAKLSDMAVE